LDETEYLEAGQVRGELKTFTREATDIPLGELHRYILAHYGMRGELSPYKVEDAVAQIFRDAAYEVTATARSNDGGIDLFVFEKNGTGQAAVQIKRSKNKIGAELIRSFAGALLYEGATRGIFVTTSEYTVNARRTAERFSHERGYQIELIDAQRLYDILKIYRRDRYASEGDETAPFAEAWRDPSQVATVMLSAFDRIEI
jgi:hypothetical protein